MHGASCYQWHVFDTLLLCYLFWSFLFNFSLADKDSMTLKTNAHFIPLCDIQKLYNMLRFNISFMCLHFNILIVQFSLPFILAVFHKCFLDVLFDIQLFFWLNITFCIWEVFSRLFIRICSSHMMKCFDSSFKWSVTSVTLSKQQLDAQLDQAKTDQMSRSVY